MYLEHKLRTPKSKFVMEEAVVQLRQNGINEEVIQSLKTCMERAEFVRYAPGSDTTDARKELLDIAAVPLTVLSSRLASEAKHETRTIDFLCGTIVLFSCTVLAQTPKDAFNRGNELYRAGKYQEAVKEYESIIKQGKFSAELYFNLGNAYYRDRQLARAILSYERAAQLHPNDPDIEHNLKLAYLKTVDRIEAGSRYVSNSMDARNGISDAG